MRHLGGLTKRIEKKIREKGKSKPGIARVREEAVAYLAEDHEEPITGGDGLT